MVHFFQFPGYNGPVRYQKSPSPGPGGKPSPSNGLQQYYKFTQIGIYSCKLFVRVGPTKDFYIYPLFRVHTEIGDGL